MLAAISSCDGLVIVKDVVNKLRLTEVEANRIENYLTNQGYIERFTTEEIQLTASGFEQGERSWEATTKLGGIAIPRVASVYTAVAGQSEPATGDEQAPGADDSSQAQYLPQLRDQIASSFSLEELQLLVFDLGLDWEDLQGTGKTARVQNLIVQLERNGRLSELIDLVREKRQHLSWPTLPPLEQQRQEGRELPLLAADGETTKTFPNHRSKHYIKEWRFGGIPQQLGAVVSTYAELRPDILFRVTPKNDGRVRIAFTRQVDFTDPPDRIVAQGWAIVQSLPHEESMVHLFALNPKHWLYLEPVWDEVVVELKRQGWTMEKVADETNAAVTG